MDMSIMGEGFFMVKSTSGTTDMSFTRNGSFSVNSERFVVDSGGQALQVYPVNDSGTVISTGIADTRPLRLPLDRNSVVLGTSVSVRVDLGGRRIVKKNNKEYNMVS